MTDLPSVLFDQEQLFAQMRELRSQLEQARTSDNTQTEILEAIRALTSGVGDSWNQYIVYKNYDPTTGLSDSESNPYDNFDEAQHHAGTDPRYGVWRRRVFATPYEQATGDYD